MNWDAFINALTPVYGASESAAIARILKQENIEPDSAIERLLRAEPLQYILGKTWFYKHEFLIASGALIPRPETEELVDYIMKFKHPIKKGIDIGTGSGCIGISLALAYPNCSFTATDLSPQALNIAQKNAHALSCKNITFLAHDFLNEAFPGNDYSLIVSNPPYITPKEAESMEKNVMDYEPHMALFTPEDDVLIFYKRLAKFLSHQASSCVLYAEINAALGQETLDLFSDFPHRNLLKDMSGKDRFIAIKKEG
jgi:release factor glutamine methyltransferase